MKKIILILSFLLATIASFSQNFNEFDAAWFGVIADWNGITGTNQVTNFNTIISKVPEGSTIYFRDGDYYFASGITITSKRDLTFVGSDSTRFFFIGGSTCITLTSCTNFTFDNINFERTTGVSSTSDAFRVVGGTGFKLHNIDVQDFNLLYVQESGINIHENLEVMYCNSIDAGGNSILLQRVKNFSIQKCKFINSALDGIKCNKKTSFGDIGFCYFESCGDDNIDSFGGGSDLLIHDCTFNTGGNSFKNGGEYPNCYRPDLGRITLLRDSFYNSGMTVTSRYEPFISKIDSITGDGVRDTFSIAHNLNLAGSSNYDVTAFTAGYTSVAIDTAEAISNNTIRVTFSTAPSGKVLLKIMSDACANDFVTDTIGVGATTFTLPHNFDTDTRIDYQLRRVLNFGLDTNTVYISKEPGQVVFTFPYGLSYDVEVHIRERYVGLPGLVISQCAFYGKSVINQSASSDLVIEKCEFVSDSLGGSTPFLNLRPPISETIIRDNKFRGPGNTKVFTGIIMSSTTANNFEGAISSYGTFKLIGNEFDRLQRAVTNNAGTVSNSEYIGNNCVNLVDGSSNSGFTFGINTTTLNGKFYRKQENNIYVSSTNSQTTPTGVINTPTGYRINNAAPSRHLLIGDGTNYVDGTLVAGDIPDLSGTYLVNGGNTGAVVAGSNNSTLELESNGVTGLTMNTSQAITYNAYTSSSAFPGTTDHFVTQNSSGENLTKSAATFLDELNVYGEAATFTVTLSTTDTLKDISGAITSSIGGIFTKVGDIVEVNLAFYLSAETARQQTVIKVAPPAGILASDFDLKHNDAYDSGSNIIFSQVGTENVDTDHLNARILDTWADTATDAIWVAVDLGDPPNGADAYPDNRYKVTLSIRYLIK